MTTFYGFDLHCVSTPCPKGWVSRVTATSKRGLRVSIARRAEDLGWARDAALDEMGEELMRRRDDFVLKGHL